jgi:hypothetical protein
MLGYREVQNKTKIIYIAHYTSILVSLHDTLEIFLCSMFALQLKTVLLLDALQLLMLSAGTLISLDDKMPPLNIFYLKQNTYS